MDYTKLETALMIIGATILMGGYFFIARNRNAKLKRLMLPLGFVTFIVWFIIIGVVLVPPVARVMFLLIGIPILLIWAFAGTQFLKFCDACGATVCGYGSRSCTECGKDLKAG